MPNLFHAFQKETVCEKQALEIINIIAECIGFV